MSEDLDTLRAEFDTAKELHTRGLRNLGEQQKIVTTLFLHKNLAKARLGKLYADRRAENAEDTLANICDEGVAKELCQELTTTAYVVLFQGTIAGVYTGMPLGVVLRRVRAYVKEYIEINSEGAHRHVQVTAYPVRRMDAHPQDYLVVYDWYEDTNTMEELND